MMFLWLMYIPVNNSTLPWAMGYNRRPFKLTLHNTFTLAPVLKPEVCILQRMLGCNLYQKSLRALYRRTSLLLTPFHYQVCQMAASVFQRVAAHRQKNSSVPPLLVMHAERILCQPPHGVRELECCLFIAAHLLPPTPSLPHWTGPAQQIEKSYMAIRILLSPSV